MSTFYVYTLILYFQFHIYQPLSFISISLVHIPEPLTKCGLKRAFHLKLKILLVFLDGTSKYPK